MPSFASYEKYVYATHIEQKINEAMINIEKACVFGPDSVDLAGQARLNLGKDYIFVPQKEAAAYMQAVGNTISANLIGLIFDKTGDMSWIISIEYKPEGYIREDDAKNWNTDELLKSLIDGTEAANKDRKASGYEPLRVVGWIEKPSYDAVQHKLIWSIEGKIDDAPPSSDPNNGSLINYHTYALGRYGYLELTLITHKSSLGFLKKVHASNILQSITFNNGNRYEDFVEGKDNVAKYGLTALILGVAAKKMGFIAMAGVFLAKMWKLVAVVFVLLTGFIARLFAGRNNKK